MTGVVPPHPQTTLFLQVICGPVKDAQRVRELHQRWVEQLSPNAEGWVAADAGVTDTGEYVGVFRFVSAEAARRNSQRPEQDQWWRELHEQFSGDVLIADCPEMEEYGDARPDDAGFMQLVLGRGENIGGMLREITQAKSHHTEQSHLDVLGGLIAATGGGQFADVIYYTSEDAARSGPTGEFLQTGITLIEKLGGFVTDVRVYEVRNPWLARHYHD